MPSGRGWNLDLASDVAIPVPYTSGLVTLISFCNSSKLHPQCFMTCASADSNYECMPKRRRSLCHSFVHAEWLRAEIERRHSCRVALLVAHSLSTLYDTGSVTVSQRDNRTIRKSQYHSPYFGGCTGLSVDSIQTECTDNNQTYKRLST